MARAPLPGRDLEERRDSRFPGEREVWFHHALMRDAAYGLLLDADRASAHRMAGAYLEASGERDPLVLAEHYQLGGRRIMRSDATCAPPPSSSSGTTWRECCAASRPAWRAAPTARPSGC